MDVVQLVQILKDDKPTGIQIRQGKIISYDGTTKRSTITIGGSTTELTGIRHMAPYVPAAGHSVVIVVNGIDLFILGRLEPSESQWLTSGITAASGWTLFSNQRLRRVGDVVSFSLGVERTGGSITVPANGDVTNTVVATMPEGWRPVESQAAASFATGPLTSWFVAGGTGEITLCAIASGATITTGTRLSISGVYLLG